MAIFIHNPIASKDLPKVRVKSLLVALTATGSKCHWMQSPKACLCKKVETLAQHVARDKIHLDVIVARLAEDMAKSFSGEVSPENGELAMVITFKD
jgi:hypothetical protein